jgi:hypothetical protein
MRRAMKAVPLVVLCAVIIAVPSVRASWVQDGVALCTATGDQQYPQIISDGMGGAIVAWYDYRSGESDIYAQRLNASGAVQWAADGVGLCTATGSQTDPVITSDGAGGAIVAWTDSRSGNDDIYVQRLNASGAVQWTPDGVALCAATAFQYGPQIISDGAGGAIVTWNDNRGGYYDIYAQRVNASGAAQWAANGVAICTAPQNQGYPTIAADGAGGAIIAWYDFRNGDNDVYAQRVNASGVVQWAANGVPLCTATAYQNSPKIISDGAGGAIVAWYDYRSGSSYDIYAQRVNASGAIQWMANGVALCTAIGDQDYPVITSDGAGGAIVAWWDYRREVFAQRVNASGAVQWAAGGVALCAATADQESPAITSDGAGGAIVTWSDYHNASSYDIYVQRLNASGAIQWTMNGVSLCAARWDQEAPQIATDGASGAIVTWMDGRGTYWDIYAQRINANATAVFAPAAPIVLDQNYPNPFNPATTIKYSIPEKCAVTLKIYDVAGKCVACLIDRQQGEGSYAVEWGGEDGRGKSVASGIYVCRLAAGNQTISKKMVLLR